MRAQSKYKVIAFGEVLVMLDDLIAKFQAMGASEPLREAAREVEKMLQKEALAGGRYR